MLLNFGIPKGVSRPCNLQHILSINTLQAAWDCTPSKMLCRLDCVKLIQDYTTIASYGVAKGKEKKIYVHKIIFRSNHVSKLKQNLFKNKNNCRRYAP